MTTPTNNLLREQLVKQLPSTKEWDLVVIGGGATGLGIALDACTRGFSVLLLESHDYAKGTSSRSTKLVHGGVRYLAQGDIALVQEALRERGRLAANAPHLFKNQAFIIPGEHFWTAPYYTLGLWIYDRLAGTLSIGKTRYLSKALTQQRLKGVKPSKIKAGVCYYDGQFDDARLAINLYRTIITHGGVAINYCPVTRLTKNSDGKINGVTCRDEMSQQEYSIKAKAVINATGVFANTILTMDEPQSKPKIVPSQGIHLVLDREFLPTDDALMVPKTSDGRVLFAVPWHNKLVVGTTDTLVKEESYEPNALEEEVQFILDNMEAYFTKTPSRDDVKSVYVGLRPLAAPTGESKETKEVSRSHRVEVSESNLVNIFGGKWTTYRQMAEDTIDTAIKHRLLESRVCKTANLPIHGYLPQERINEIKEKHSSQDDFDLSVYGSDALLIEELITTNPVLNERIHSDYPYTYALVEWAILYEQAQTIEDILARRIRLLFLDAKAAQTCSKAVASFMAEKLGWDESRLNAEVETFNNLAQSYQI